MKQNTIRTLLIKRNKSNDKLKIEDTIFIDTLDNLYKLLECETIDIQERYINGIAYDFIIDDEYLLNGKSQEPRNAIACGTLDNEIKEIIFYSLIICHSDQNTGKETSLNDKDIENILSNIKIVETNTKEQLQVIAYNFN